MVVAAGRSLLAYFTPDASPVWYWKLPDAAAASPRVWMRGLTTCWPARKARGAATAGDTMVDRYVRGVGEGVYAV